MKILSFVEPSIGSDGRVCVNRYRNTYLHIGDSPASCQDDSTLWRLGPEKSSKKVIGEEVKLETEKVKIRAAMKSDLGRVTEIDVKNTGIKKAEYWEDMFNRYGEREGRFFLIAEYEGAACGFIIGEVRAWEFGSPPCGWIFAIGVDPDARLKKTGSHLFAGICRSLKESGVDKVRTMLARDDSLNMAFFRSQGMMGGPFIQLEMPLD